MTYRIITLREERRGRRREGGEEKEEKRGRRGEGRRGGDCIHLLTILKVARPTVFSRSTNLESKLKEFFVFVKF